MNAMKSLKLKNRFQSNTTTIENDFIDHHMAKANGEYVKVYLLLLRHLHDEGSPLTISRLADYLDCTEKDIVRALNYWSNEGLLQIYYDEAGNINGLAIGKSCDTHMASKAPAEELAVLEVPSPAPAPAAPVVPAPSKSNEDLQQLYFVTEQYLGKPLSATELKKINYFFDELHFSVDLIEYLIEYCVENGHKSMHYIESVALAWSDAQITTVAEARTNSSLYHKNSFAVLKAFGIKGRNPAPIELSYIKRWIDEYGFTLDIVLEACNRTIANTSKPDFKYADSILSSWLAKGVHHLKDIERVDQAYQQERMAKKRAAAAPKPAPSNNRFNNFESRTYDISSLEQQLLSTP